MNKTIVFGSKVLFGVIVLFSAISAYLYYKDDYTEQEIEAIKRDIEINLPKGSTYEQVESYLQESYFKDNYHYKDNRFSGRPGAYFARMRVDPDRAGSRDGVSSYARRFRDVFHSGRQNKTHRGNGAFEPGRISFFLAFSEGLPETKTFCFHKP